MSCKCALSSSVSFYYIAIHNQTPTSSSWSIPLEVSQISLQFNSAGLCQHCQSRVFERSNSSVQLQALLNCSVLKSDRKLSISTVSTEESLAQILPRGLLLWAIKFDIMGPQRRHLLLTSSLLPLVQTSGAASEHLSGRSIVWCASSVGTKDSLIPYRLWSRHLQRWPPPKSSNDLVQEPQHWSLPDPQWRISVSSLVMRLKL